jgi:hypothetical protein
MKIDLDRLENIERAVIYIKTHEKRIIVGGKEHVLISAAVWESVQKALGESESDKESDEDDHKDNRIQFRKRFDAEGELHDHYEVGDYVLSNTSGGPRVGIVIGNAAIGYSTVAFFEKYIESTGKWLKPALNTSIKNTFLQKPTKEQIANPGMMLEAMMDKGIISYTSLTVRTTKGDILGFIMGTVRYYAGVPSTVYVATLNDAGKTGKIIIAHTANLFRMDGTPLKLPKV